MSWLLAFLTVGAGTVTAHHWGNRGLGPTRIRLAVAWGLVTLTFSLLLLWAQP